MGAAMPRLVSVRRPLRLPALFLVATLLPAATLAWLGWRLIEQDRRLERQRVQDLVGSTANSVTAAIERELGAIQRNLGSVAAITQDAHTSDTAVTVRLNGKGGATAFDGARLVYDPVVDAGRPEPPDSLWTDSER